MQAFDVRPRTRLVFGEGMLARVGGLSRELGVHRPLLVADPGLVDAGHVRRAIDLLAAEGIEAVPFHDFGTNPDSEMVARAGAHAGAHAVDAIIGLGGGSSLDCAKGANFLITGGGTIADYRGYGNARGPMLPMIAIPTTAGTGSEAQSYAVISDAATHVKMACGDPGAAFRVAILDPELTLSQPAPVTAAAGYDAIAHAVETAVTTRRTPLSTLFSREAFRLLNGNVDDVLDRPHDVEARSAMMLGAFYAGTAIEQSMLGAAHACANPLTTRYRMTHGVALAILLPHVVRWNARAVGPLYGALIVETLATIPNGDPGDRLAARLVEIARACGMPGRLRDAGVPREDLGTLARAAAEQWTGTFNPRPFAEADALEIYRCAY